MDFLSASDSEGFGMLKPTDVPAALQAIHRVLVRARTLAGEGADAKTLYQILDWAEVLPTVVVARLDDTTQEFRSLLAGLGERHPEFAGILADFDRDPTRSEIPGDDEKGARLSVTAQTVLSSGGKV